MKHKQIKYIRLEELLENPDVKIIGACVINGEEVNALNTDIRAVRDSQEVKEYYDKHVVKNPRVLKRKDGELPDFYFVGDQRNLNTESLDFRTLYPVVFFEAVHK